MEWEVFVRLPTTAVATMDGMGPTVTLPFATTSVTTMPPAVDRTLAAVWSDLKVVSVVRVLFALNNLRL